LSENKKRGEKIAGQDAKFDQNMDKKQKHR
jgi:hypothetical protein